MGLHRLLAELQERVLVHLSSTRDLGRAACVCRAWRAGDSPVARALYQRIKDRGDAVSAAAEKGSTTHRLCLLGSIGAAQDASPSVMSLGDEVASAAVDAEGHLCVWGELRPARQPPIFSYTTPTIVQAARVERVSAGSAHILALTDAGEVLSFGYGMDGRLGHGNEEKQLVPKVIEALRGVRVVAIAAGCYHSMVLTDEGEVLSFGRGGYGRLGHGDDLEDQYEPKVIETLRGVRVVAIAAGCYHSMVLTDEGTVLSFGNGGFGKLGHGDQKTQYEPKVIEALRGVRVLAIAAGCSHSMVLTDAGAVLSFGHGLGCALGHGDGKDQLEPKVIEALRDRRVVAIAAGHNYSMVLTDEGEVLSFGNGLFGRLGHGDVEYQHVPKVIEALRGVRVVAIAASSSHSMVLTDAGKVLSFGYGRYGQLGHGDEKRVQRLVPRVIEGLQANGRLVASLRDPAA